MRGRIKALKAREQVLWQAILDARPNGTVSGESFTLDVRRQVSRRLDGQQLPDHIREDPRYWKTVETQVVTTRPRRDTAPPWDMAEDFALIEPF
ncbi:hypothetical protein AVJ23_18225 [Pseudoponticoccus marisrubri]|uniref:Uncharacterized protein n=1 Tax=Pseudoponticoccus marisrubri TaxID=1685382 RepID=A0A0W7WFU8_9RHOB|nr:hypothetical protein AVJ23_18225 [Pseudoponticoccus marisrubri]